MASVKGGLIGAAFGVIFFILITFIPINNGVYWEGGDYEGEFYNLPAFILMYYMCLVGGWMCGQIIPPFLSALSDVWTDNNVERSNKKSDQFFETKIIKCKVCKSDIVGKNSLQRAAKGGAGATGGFAAGTVVGSLILPGIGTAIGALYGTYAGAGIGGSQISDICDNCCLSCENKKSECVCSNYESSPIHHGSDY